MIQTTTLRQYINSNFIDENGYSFENANLAEMIVDNYIPTYRSGLPFAKSYGREQVVDVDFVDGGVVLPASYDTTKNYYQFCNIEILSGSLNGETLSVVSSVDNKLSTNTVSLPEETTTTVKISQIGKFPFICDYKSSIKTIPNTLREACKLQLQYITENSEHLNSVNMKSETESTGSYSYTLGDSMSSESIMISPVVKKLIDSLGLYQIV